MPSRRVVVVGGGQREGETIGNGRAISVLFGRQGADVLVVDRVLDRAQGTVAQIEKEGGRAWAFAADVTRSAECAGIIEYASKVLGGLDVLVNNVGIVDGDGDALSVSEETWDLIMATNLKSVWFTCRAAIPIMREAGGGAIVNISSIAAARPGPVLAYSVSKIGVNFLTASLARDNAAYHIRVNAIMPGLIDTPIAQLTGAGAMATGETREEYTQRGASHVPLGRMGDGWDIAQAACFLASEEAGFITGVILPVDGGSGVS